VLLLETFICEVQSVTRLRGHRLRRSPPTHLHAAQTDRATGPRFHYTYPFFICSRIMEKEMLAF